MNGPEPSDTPDTSDPSATGDGVDQWLRTRLQSTVGPGTPADAHQELIELGPRFRRARRRRQVAVATVSSAAVAVLLMVGVFALDGSDAQRIDTAGDDRSRTTSTVESPTASTTTSTTSSTVPSTVTSLPADDDATDGGPGGVGEAGEQPATTTTAAPPVTSAPPPSTPVGGEQVLSGTGGTATVRWTATSITVLSTTPAAGWMLEQVEQQSSTRVVVKFRREDGGAGSRSSTIDARVVDGRLDVST